MYRRQTESRGISSLRKSNENQQKLIDSNLSAIQEKQGRLKSLQENQEANPEEENTKRIIETVNQLKQETISFNFKQQAVISQMKEFMLLYREYNTKEIKRASANELQFLDLGTELLKEHDDCPFCLNSKNSKQEIGTKVTYRKEKIKELNEILQKLNRSFNLTLDTFINLRSQVELARNKVTKEIPIAQGKTEFNTLLQIDNAFVTYVSEVLANDLYIELFGLNENPNFLKDKYQYLFELLSKNADFVETNIYALTEKFTSYIGSRADDIRKVEMAVLEKTKTRTIAEQIITINNEIKSLEGQIHEAKNIIERDTKKIQELQEIQLSFDQIKEETTAYLKIVHSVLNKEVEKAFAPIKLIVEEILSNYFKADKHDIELQISKEPEEKDEETGEILSEIITAHIVHKTQRITPQPVGKYLNTFHYRLFSTMVGVSVAIASRINTKVNLPLVLDDIFYASDFENKATIESFLNEVFKAFKQYTPDMPLQLILFTHDQQIFESAVKVIKDSDIENIGFAKQFPYKDAKVEDDFQNLIYQFPEYFPFTIMNTLYAES